MKEIEVKILEIDKKQIVSKLKKMGAKKSFDGIIQGEFFDFSDNRLDKNKEMLRLRTAGEKVFLTYKIKQQKEGKVKCCEEKEIQVSDYNTLKEIFLQIGLVIKKETMKKHRVSYSLNKTHFEIETPIENYSFIPPFMEIESNSVENIYKNAKLLGYSEKDCLNWTDGDVIKFYKKKQ
jgi:adenylate cyclase, class 2